VNALGRWRPYYWGDGVLRAVLSIMVMGFAAVGECRSVRARFAQVYRVGADITNFKNPVVAE